MLEALQKKKPPTLLWLSFLSRDRVPHPMQQQSSGNRRPVSYDDHDCSTSGAHFWSDNGSSYAGGAEAWRFFRIPRYDRAHIAQLSRTQPANNAHPQPPPTAPLLFLSLRIYHPLILVGNISLSSHNSNNNNNNYT